MWNIFYMLRLLCLSLYSLLVYICICYLIICIPLCIMCIWLLLVRNLIHPHKHHYLIAYQIRITCIYLKFHNASSLRIILRTGCLLTEKMVCIYSMLLNCQRVHNFRLMVWHNFLLQFFHIHQNKRDNCFDHINSIRQDMRMLFLTKTIKRLWLYVLF